MSPGGGWLRSPWEAPHLAPELAISMGSLSTCFMCCSLLMAVPPPPRPVVGMWNRSTLVGPAAVGFRSLLLDDCSLPWRLGGHVARSWCIGCGGSVRPWLSLSDVGGLPAACSWQPAAVDLPSIPGDQLDRVQTPSWDSGPLRRLVPTLLGRL